MFLKKVSKFLLLTNIFIGIQVFPQTTPLSFTNISINDPDLNAPGRGAEQWHDRNDVNVPIEGTNTERLDIYFRFVWTRIEGPTLGSYTWNYFDSLVNYAITKKQKMSFGIMQLYPGGTVQNGLVSFDGGYASYPLYLHTLMQAESVKDWRTGTVWTPNYNSLHYQNRLLALHQAINAHLNTTSFNGVLYKNVISCIDLRGYGAWGEWHSGYTQKNVVSDYPTGTFPTIATLKKIVDAHTQGFPDYPLVAMIAAFDANWLQNTMNPPEIAYYVLTQRNNWGLIGWRRDQWGATDAYIADYLENNTRTFGGIVFKDSIMARWKSAPITGEPPGWNPNNFADLERQVKLYHAASFGNGNFGTTPTSTIKSRVRASSKACGYRLILESGNLTLNGNNLTVALNWKNIGQAPTYDNWNVEFQLKNSNNQTVWIGQSQFKPKWFLPSSIATIVTDNFTSLPAGTFNLNIIIKDPNGYRDPLPLAITGKNADGSYPIMQQITIQSSVPTPNVAVTNNCGNSVLTASGHTGTLLWSTGENTPSITVTAPGIYTVTQTVGGSTSAPGSGTAAPKTIPSTPAVTMANNCGNSLLTATGVTGTLLWSTGQTTSSITVTSSGIYTVTQTINGCTSAAGSGTAAPLNSAVDAPVVNVVNNCDNSVLTATDYTGTLLWSNGATTSSITVTNAGSYTVTQTINGCSSPAASGTSAPKPTPAAPGILVSNNCGNSVLTATGVTGSVSWNTGETTNSITVPTAGTYTVSQIVNGCTSSSGSGTAAPNATPATPGITVVNNCGSSVLTATGFSGTLHWSTGETTNSITVATGGIYTVTQTVNGCTSAPGSGTAAPLNSAVDPPAVNVVNNCDNSVLTATDFTGTLLWSNGATTSSITVTTAGSYTVTQTINGCSSPAANATSAPKPTPAAPGVSVNNNCGSSVLTATGVTGSVSWSTGETTNSITVPAAGTYTVSQIVNGCTSLLGSAIAAPNATPATPGVTVVNNCGSSVLTATGVSGTLHWSTGETTNSITVATGGTYTVTQTLNGCTSAAGSGTAAPLNSAVEAPVVNVVNNCDNSVLTTTEFTGTLLWSNGATTPSIIVTTEGSYTVTQTINGCSSPAASATSAPKPTPAAPGVSVSNNCGSSVLTATGVTGSVSWSTGETTNSITVPAAGTYTLSQTLNGCTSLLGSAIAAPNATPATPGVTVVNNCGSSVLTATGVSGALHWSTGETTNSITVATAGGYTVTQTINGCTSAAGSGTAAPLTSTVDAPVVDVANNCNNSVLTATGVTGSILWSTGETTSAITVTTAATYTVTQTVNGCSSPAGSGTAAPTPIPSAPGIVVSNNCGNSVLTATAVTGSLLWSTGETTNFITTPTAGSYTVSQTLNGCTSSLANAAAAPKAIPTAPGISVSNNCGSSVLTATGFTGSLLWSTGQTTNSITVTTAGTYTVTQTINGCTSAAGSGTAAPLTTAVAAPVVNVVNNCNNSVLTATGFTGTLLWSNGATTPSITVTAAGTYTVTQTENGCTSPAGSGVAAPKPIPVLSSNLSATSTSGTAFTYSATSTTAGTTFAWSRAAVTGISNAAASGTGNINETLINTTALPVNVTYVYTLTANGCSNNQNLVVTVNPVATVNCVINGSIASTFTATSIPAGRFIWFSSVVDKGNISGVTGTVTFNITNSRITFTANSQQYTLNVPNSRIRFDAAVTSATTQFVNNVWETAVPRSYNGFVFMGGLNYQVLANLPGSISNVTWTATISIDKSGIRPTWKWAAAVYTSLGAHSALGIKPKNGKDQNPYPNNDNAGTPENYKSFVVSGAKGTGGTNYTGSYSSTSTATCSTSVGQRSAEPVPVTTEQLIVKDIPALQIELSEGEKLEATAVPNPTSTSFNLLIKGSRKSPVSIKVIDISGRVIERYEKIPANYLFKVGQRLAAGSYFVEVIQDDQKKIIRVIKVN